MPTRCHHGDESRRLTDSPWTPNQLESAASRGLRAAQGTRTSHGTVSRYSAGCRCKACHDAHLHDLKVRRAARRDRFWSPDRVDALLTALAAGTAYRDAAEAAGVTPQAITKRRLRNDFFSRRLDAALRDGRDPHLPHGTHKAWQVGCRCPECRDHHHATAH